MLSRRSLFRFAPVAAAAPLLPFLPEAEKEPDPRSVRLPARMLQAGAYVTIFNAGDDKLMVYP